MYKKNVLCLRHTIRNIPTGILTAEGAEMIKRVIKKEDRIFDLAFAANVLHCLATAWQGLDRKVIVNTDYRELDDLCPFHDDLKYRAAAQGIDHSTLWFNETPRDEILTAIAGPGEAYEKGIRRALMDHPADRPLTNALFVLRGSGLEGLAFRLDPSYSPFGGKHFAPCEGFWLQYNPSGNTLRLIHYVRS